MRRVRNRMIKFLNNRMKKVEIKLIQINPPTLRTLIISLHISNTKRQM